MTSTSFHNRGEILRRVIDAADSRRDGRLPMDLDGVAEKFDDELDLLSALQLRWHTRLAGRIEQQLADQPMDLEAAVVAAWHGVADAMPGVRAILDHYRAEPLDAEMALVMTKAVNKERILLAVMAGHAGVADELAVQVGQRIEERARATYRRADLPAVPSVPLPRASLIDRLRAALAA
ncbi:MAG TPA: hypothetical protein VGE38_08340 [Nocardioides sp.]|uniref:hypothetical protein n=1 Tax=Nocardioides sp. TaxID=35761 RepID=UPI002ED8EA5B